MGIVAGHFTVLIVHQMKKPYPPAHASYEVDINAIVPPIHLDAF